MNRVQRSQLVAIACLTLLFGCAAGPGGPGEPAAGRCRPIGDLSPLGQGDVYLNGRRIERRTRVCDGDRVSTGVDSGAWLAFPGGGHVHFDEGTDPIFRLLRDLVIEVLDLNRGQVHAEPPPGGQLVMRNPDGTFETLGTAFNLRVEPERSLLTVLAGSVRLSRPSAGAVRASEQVGLRRGELLYRRVLSPSELQEVVRWRERYPPPGREAPKDKPSSVPWLIGPVLTIPRALTRIIHQTVASAASKDKDKDRTRPEPRPTDTGSPPAGTSDGSQPAPDAASQVPLRPRSTSLRQDQSPIR